MKREATSNIILICWTGENRAATHVHILLVIKTYFWNVKNRTSAPLCVEDNNNNDLLKN